ncbi:hypothetical protein FOC1_g10003844 [Fusarium oxysporum f. sp. cubense race 1]|uniref:Uncharacterized protein n=1 Tax=Fusarium oxysporum f. sp. cubense (strain race 1) TaxID=1229664 RepID=N4UZY0_FUSC1|nr:hypothetical protein FOC1_g10003844 [Fusarium oxysporum f. sp. cubense race 1]
MSSNQHNVQSYTKLTTKEYQSYTNTRKQIYGQNVNTRLHPTPQAERDYNTYSQWREQSNASRDQYEKSLKEAIGPNGNFQMLQQRQHQDLVLPAAQAATDTNFTRNDFLDKHPYAYKNARARKQHEKLADNSVKEAKHYRQAYDTHYEKAGAPAPPIRQAPYGTHGSSTAATPGIPSLQPSLPVPTPRQAENSRIPSPSEAYGQAYYSTQSSTRTSVSTPYGQQPPVSAPLPPHLYGPRLPSPEQAYGNNSSSRKMDRRQ